MTDLSPEARTDRAKLAAETRWGKRFDWETETIESCHARLADLRAEAEKGGLTLARRSASERISSTTCYNPTCNKPIDITSGRFAGSRARINPESGEMEVAYACSAACYLYLGSNFRSTQQPIREPIIEVNPDVVNNEPAIPKL